MFDIRVQKDQHKEEVFNVKDRRFGGRQYQEEINEQHNRIAIVRDDSASYPKKHHFILQRFIPSIHLKQTP